MIVKVEFTESMKYEAFKVTKRGDGRYVCRIPISYETGEDVKKTFQYKNIYGVDEMDTRIKRAEFIDCQIQSTTQEKRVSQMLVTKMEEECGWKVKRMKATSTFSRKKKSQE